MTGVGLQVRSIAILSGAVQIVVPLNQLGHLFVDVRKLLCGELVLVWTHFLLPQESEEAKLVLQEEEEGASAALRASACSAHSVNIVIWIIGRVKLDDPIDFREIKTTLRNISAQKNAFLSLTEFEIGRCTLLLFLFAVNVLHWNIDIIEQVRVELDRVAARHEDHDLFLEVLAEERVEELELAGGIHQNIPLLQVGHGRCAGVFRDFDEDWILEGQSAQVFHLLRHGG